jgi:predicted HTH transcriptional regulator
MTRSESLIYDPAKVKGLQKIVSPGEGQQLEFKRKATFPEKIVRELIAFANTDGGTLLIGVDDDRTIPGVKFPEEESLAVQQALKKHCRPMLHHEEIIVPISEKKYVLQWYIPRSDRRPHYFVLDGKKETYVRQRDQSIKASREMSEIIRRRKSQHGTRFTYGEAEQKIIHFLDAQPTISLREFAQLTGLNRFLASRKIIRLVLANVLKITPTEKGDVFSRVQE